MAAAKRSLQQEFDRYIATVYPDPPAPDSDQYRQLRNVFFAGAVVVYHSPQGRMNELLQHMQEAYAEAEFSRKHGGGNGQRVH